MNNYKNIRLVLRPSGHYALAEVTYSEDGHGAIKSIEYKYDLPLGNTLEEVRDTLEGVLSDMDNWILEELKEEEIEFFKG